MTEMTPLEAAEIIMNPRGYGTSERNTAECMAAALLRKIASGEYAPVVHARWINQSYIDEPVVCSNCNRCPAELAYRGGFADEEYRRCPLCGAVMDGKELDNAID